ncbi:MAG: P-type conjugative transfer ATPase TrbB [Rhodobacteraceae bacterium]|nr:P-type conjugative transfer ATPase TrbB [Paracoccaceae bacterium]
MTTLTAHLRKIFGPHAALLCGDGGIVEVSANSDGQIWIDRAGEGLSRAGELGDRQRDQIVRLAATAAGVVVTASSPIVSCRLPELGYRFEGLLPPAVESPVFSIRFHGLTSPSLSDYAERGVLCINHKSVLERAIDNKLNILVAGSTGSGKTTLLNALLGELHAQQPTQRVVVIEDTPEICSPLPNTVFLRTSAGADATRLLASTLRLRPDRIFVGEVRDGAALALLKAWNTGHPGGMASIHANSARDALVRLDLLVREASVAALPEVIGAAVDMVVFMERTDAGRRVSEIISVEGYENGRYITSDAA